jgi:hypothetical protein
MVKIDFVSENRPDFIIIGAMKCATSTLHDQLNLQNAFFMTNPKEPNFFSDDEIYKKGHKWYESLFKAALPGQLKGESSTHYTKLPRYPETVRRISSYCPDTKFIYIMRHPVDRFISQYVHEWTQKIISCDIDRAVYSFPELVDYGRYNMQIEPYLNAFGSSAVLPLFVERLSIDPLRELQSVFRFLNVNAELVWHSDLKSNVSAERIRSCAWRDAIVDNGMVRILRRAFVPKKIRIKIRSLWAMKEKPELSTETLEYVEKLFDRDLKLLGEKLGLDLNCRNFKDTVTSQKSISWVV